MNRRIYLLAATGLVGCAGYAFANRAAETTASGTPGQRMLADVEARTNPAAADASAPAQCGRDEERYTSIETAVFNPWRAGWSGKNARALAAVGQQNLTVLGFPSALPVGARSEGGVELTTWAQDQQADAASYLAQFASVEHVDFDTVQVKAVGNRLADGGYATAEMMVAFDVRGLDQAGWRRNDRGTMRVVASLAGGAWKVDSVAVIAGETVRAEKASFTDVTATAKLDGVPTYTRIEAMRRGGYAIAMGDYDNDGNVDMYVGAWGAGTLLKGDAAGQYAPVSGGLAGETLVKTATFADFDNDGWQDLLLVRFTPDYSQDIVVYHNDKGTFVNGGAVFTGRTPAGHAMPAAVADFNGDGALDIYVGYPGAKDFTVIQNLPKSDLAVQGLLINDGKGQFSDQTKMAFQGSAPDTLYAHSVMAVDYDDDNDSDLVVIDDRGGLSPVYKNEGNGHFTQVAEDIGLGNEGFGMGTAAADINGDGLTDFVLTNVDFAAGQRFRDSCTLNWNFAGLTTPQKGLRAFHNLGGGKFEEVTDSVGLTNPGEGLAGAEFLDYDNDGDADLYVANGLWSGTTPDSDITSLFVRAYSNRVKWGEAAALLSYQPENDAELKDWYAKQTENPDPHRMESQSTFMKVLTDWQGAGGERMSMAGFERNRLYRNDGGHFVEVGYAAGVDSVADGYVIARADYDHDGRIDIVLRNGDPGTKDYTYAPVQMFRNESPMLNSLQVRLEGGATNRDGIGAHVSAVVNGVTHVQQLIGNNGTAQSEKVLHFGMGNASMVTRLTVQWPDGTVQTLKDVAAGTVTVKETAQPAVADK